MKKYIIVALLCLLIPSMTLKADSLVCQNCTQYEMICDSPSNMQQDIFNELLKGWLLYGSPMCLSNSGEVCQALIK